MSHPTLRALWGVLILCAVAVGAPATGAQKAIKPRLPVYAGTQYPADPETLLKSLSEFRDAADAPEVPSFLFACIASPAPYGLTGKTSAHAFKHLKPGQYSRVIVLTSAHMADLEGCSIPAVDAFLTPLGPVALDQEAVRQLTFSPLFATQELHYGQKAGKKGNVHTAEYGVENLLPYLQERLLEFKLVPIVVGRLTTASGKFSPSAAESVAKSLRPLLDNQTLLVVSSSFTHFGNDFSNRPFNDNILGNIEHLDRQAFECILSGDAGAFQSYLDRTKNVIDGANCIHILLRLLPAGTQVRILDYAVSGALTGDMNRSVSYAAFTFHDPNRPEAPARPDAVRPLPLPGIPAGPTAATAPTPENPASPPPPTEPKQAEEPTK